MSTIQTIRLYPSVLPQALPQATKPAPARLPRVRPAIQQNVGTDEQPRAVEIDTAYGPLLAHRLYEEARAHRSAAIAQVLGACLRSFATMLGRAFEAYRRHSRTRATYRTLSQLDTSTLRDLGFHRSELMSVAAELSGEAYPTRARVMSRRQQLRDRAYAHGTPFRWL